MINYRYAYFSMDQHPYPDQILKHNDNQHDFELVKLI